jgi:hypothetical protein
MSRTWGASPKRFQAWAFWPLQRFCNGQNCAMPATPRTVRVTGETESRPRTYAGVLRSAQGRAFPSGTIGLTNWVPEWGPEAI